jgi:hypothetical protein
MVSVLASSVVDHGFKPRSGQAKDYAIVICCFSAKHAALRRKDKDWLAQNQNNATNKLYYLGLFLDTEHMVINFPEDI